MSGHAWAEVAGGFALFAGIATVLTVTIWQLAANWRAKLALVREDEYRALAERSIRAQEETRRQLAGLDERLTATHSRVESVERILREVD